MPARNIHHDAVVRALTADGWTVTHDPLTISFGGKDLFVDLGAERTTLAAERGGQRIAVEVQSFINPSPVRDLQEAVGQMRYTARFLRKPSRTVSYTWQYLAASTRASSRSGLGSSSLTASACACWCLTNIKRG